jgi:hypothetical protein
MAGCCFQSTVCAYPAACASAAVTTGLCCCLYPCCVAAQVLHPAAAQHCWIAITCMSSSDALTLVPTHTTMQLCFARYTSCNPAAAQALQLLLHTPCCMPPEANNESITNCTVQVCVPTRLPLILHRCYYAKITRPARLLLKLCIISTSWRSWCCNTALYLTPQAAHLKVSPS